MTHLKRPWCWARLKAGGEGDDRGWDGWMASLTEWAWVWASFGSWWWTGRPVVLQSMGSQRVTHNWATELNWLQIIAAGQCIHKTKRHLFLGTKAMTNLDSVLKIVLLTKVHIVKTIVFPVVIVLMWQLDHKEDWVLKNLCFLIVVLGKTLESPWAARRWHQSILKEINPEYSLKGLMLKLSKRLRAGGEEGDRG